MNIHDFVVAIDEWCNHQNPHQNPYSSIVEHWSCYAKDVGSIPTVGTVVCLVLRCYYLFIVLGSSHQLS